MNPNLFPAILLAGPPHCGKSVLAFLLTRSLRELGIAHYLLRAVPDGEGDWFLTGQSEVVQTLRNIHKVGYSPRFIAHMHSAIENRLLPLLVDIGGRPQGEQFALIKACTHSILLYRNEQECLTWRGLLQTAHLLPIAELQSTLDEEQSIHALQPCLRGTVNGLHRDLAKRKTGMTFGALLDRVAGICTYDSLSLEQLHLRHAPFPVVNERELAQKISVPVEGERVIWSPQHLRRIPEFVPKATPLAIYGRAPVWVAAALAIYTLPASFAIFDARYGWLLPPPIRFDTPSNLDITHLPYRNDANWIEIQLPGGTLEPDEIILTPLPTQGGLVLSGKIPRWLFAALSYYLAPHHDWVAVDDPHLTQVVVVHSQVATPRVGDALQRLVSKDSSFSI